MKFFFIILFGLCCSNHISFAQNGNYAIGARSAGLAESSVTIADEWSVFNNIGALSYVETISVFGTYRNLYGISELSSIAIGATLPILNGTAALGAFRFGGDLLNEQRVNLGFSNRFGIVSLGANISYFQMNIQGGGSRNTFMFDFGGHAKITEQLYFGAHVSNINQARLSEVRDERIPTVMKTGLSYRPYDKLMMNIEVEKKVEANTQLKLGLEYEIIETVFVRTGVTTKPFKSNFGMGFSPNKFSVDYAFGSHPDLGDIHQMSFTYRIKQ